MVDEFKGEKFPKKLVPLVTNGLKGGGMSGTRTSMEYEVISGLIAVRVLLVFHLRCHP